MLKKQTYQNFEIVIIDSGSQDDTLKIARQYTTKIETIPEKDFTYPYALNVGCQKASAKKYLVFLSAHSVPISSHWLTDGLENSHRFYREKITGVYGGVWALPDGSIWEKIIFNAWLGKMEILFNRKKCVKKTKMGVLGFTNAIIRKDLYLKRSLNEKYAGGGEDGE